MLLSSKHARHMLKHVKTLPTPSDHLYSLIIW